MWLNMSIFLQTRDTFDLLPGIQLASRVHDTMLMFKINDLGDLYIIKIIKLIHDTPLFHVYIYIYIL